MGSVIAMEVTACFSLVMLSATLAIELTLNAVIDGSWKKIRLNRVVRVDAINSVLLSPSERRTSRLTRSRRLGSAHK